MDEPPALLWGLDPVFLTYARLYIKDILELKESKQIPGIFFYRDHPIKQVDIMGIVVCVREKDAFYSYGVDDSTGVISCTCWKTSRPSGSSSEAPSSAAAANDLEGLMRELYKQESGQSKMEIGDVIRARGYIKVFRDQRELVASTFYKVRDPTLDVQIGRMLELPYLYRQVYDKPITLPDHVKSQGHSDHAVLQRNVLVTLLSEKIMEFVGENKISNFYQREVESVPSLLAAATHPPNSMEGGTNTTRTAREIHSVFKEAIDLLLKRGAVYQKGPNKDVYKVTDHDKELHKLTLNIIKEDCKRQRHADKGCHFLHVLSCVRQGFGSCVSEAMLQRVIDALENNSDIISTMEKYYTAF